MASGGVSSPTDRLTNTQFSMEELVAIVEEAEASGAIRLLSRLQPSRASQHPVCLRSSRHVCLCPRLHSKSNPSGVEGWCQVKPSIAAMCCLRHLRLCRARWEVAMPLSRWRSHECNQVYGQNDQRPAVQMRARIMSYQTEAMGR